MTAADEPTLAIAAAHNLEHGSDVIKVTTTVTAAPPPCDCKAEGQPMTEFGVMHLADCAWFRQWGSSRCIEAPGGSRCVKPLHHDGPCAPEAE